MRLGRTRSRLRQILGWAPWAIGVGFAGWWGLGGLLAGLPFLAGLAIFWILVLVVLRDAIAARTTRASRVPADVVLVAASFVLAWEGGWSILPATVAFLVADLIDPETRRFPIGGSLRGRGPAVLAAGILALAISVVLAGGLFSSASSVATPLPS